MSREEVLRSAKPHLTAEVRLYATADGGKDRAPRLGFACLCAPSPDVPPSGYDAFPLLFDGPLAPGEARRLGFFFINPKGADELSRLGRFFLFEGHRRFGEAVVARPHAE